MIAKRKDVIKASNLIYNQYLKTTNFLLNPRKDLLCFPHDG